MATASAPPILGKRRRRARPTRHTDYMDVAEPAEQVNGTMGHADRMGGSALDALMREHRDKSGVGVRSLSPRSIGMYRHIEKHCSSHFLTRLLQ